MPHGLRKKRCGGPYLYLEPLESRQLLAVAAAPLAPVALAGNNQTNLAIQTIRSTIADTTAAVTTPGVESENGAENYLKTLGSGSEPSSSSTDANDSDAAEYQRASSTDPGSSVPIATSSSDPVIVKQSTVDLETYPSNSPTASNAAITGPVLSGVANTGADSTSKYSSNAAGLTDTGTPFGAYTQEYADGSTAATYYGYDTGYGSPADWWYAKEYASSQNTPSAATLAAASQFHTQMMAISSIPKAKESTSAPSVPVELPQEMHAQLVSAPVRVLAQVSLLLMHQMGAPPQQAVEADAKISEEEQLSFADRSFFEHRVSNPEIRSGSYLPPETTVMTGALPVDLADLERGVEQFFTKLEGLGGEITPSLAMTRLAPWLVTMSLAMVATEVARLQMRRQLYGVTIVPGSTTRTWWPRTPFSRTRSRS
jgi:hypothetical protein